MTYDTGKLFCNQIIKWLIHCDGRSDFSVENSSYENYLLVIAIIQFTNMHLLIFVLFLGKMCSSLVAGSKRICFSSRNRIVLLGKFAFSVMLIIYFYIQYFREIKYI